MERILKLTIISLFSIILIVTVISLSTGNARLGYGLRNKEISEIENAVKNNNFFENKFTYFDMGQIRTSTKSEKGADRGSVVVIKARLEYEKNNQDLVEEINAKYQAIKTTFLQYFPQKTRRQIFLEGEEKTKASLLHSINSILILGKINNIYFEEYQFFE